MEKQNRKKFGQQNLPGIRISVLVLILTLINLGNLIGQNITKVEYFFDSDPGFGNGTAVAVSPSPNITSLNFSADISGLSNGFHKLLVRACQDNGLWGAAYLQSFYKASLPVASPNLVKVEYYFDNDPGIGNGIDVPVSPSPNLTTLSFTAGVSTLTAGIHKLFVRAMGTDEIWSTTAFQPFVKTAPDPALQNLVAAEYFFDNDPGFGNATPISVTPSINVSNLSFNIDINSLAAGFHKLLTRVKDANGQWSNTFLWNFYKGMIPDDAPKIAAVEYFFDTDPGFGNGQPLLLTPGNNVTLDWTIGIDQIPAGFHHLFVRSKDSAGKWGGCTTLPVYRQNLPDTPPDVVEMEYFYDSDPGFGNGIDVGISSAKVIPFKAWSLNLANLPYGSHQVFVRVKDSHDNWSLATRDTILYFLDTLPTALLSGPVTICIGSPAIFEVALTGSAPWTLIYYDGFQVDTATNIMISPFTFSIVPPATGIREARILHVHDQYYNGINTGIPIEYQAFIKPLVIAGPDISINQGDSTQLNPTVSGSYPPYTYQWTPTGQYADPNQQNTWVSPVATTEFNILVTDINGCQSTDEVIVNVVSSGMASIDGILKYDNIIHSPISFSPVYLKQANTLIAQTLTTSNGAFQFDQVPAGNYTLSASSNKPWNGVNATDALLISKHFVGLTQLIGPRIPAGDVNASGFLNSTDALLCSRRFVGTIDAFIVGNWYFENVQIDVSGFGTITHDITGLCYGDVNGSSVPGARTKLDISLQNEGTISTQPGAVVILPLRTRQSMEANAVSLSLDIPSGITVHGVNMTHGNPDNLLYNIIGKQLRIAWYALNPMSLTSGDTLLTIIISNDKLQQEDWVINSESTISGFSGEDCNPACLSIPALIKANVDFDLGLSYPNPFNQSTSFTVTLPTEGHVKLYVMNLLGENIMTIIDESLPSGNSLITIEGSTLTPGIYYCKVIADAGGMHYESSRKLFKIR